MVSASNGATSSGARTTGSAGTLTHSRPRGNGGLEAYLSSLEDQAWCYLCTEFEHKVACCPFQEEEDDLSAPKQKKKRSGHPRRRAREWVPDPAPKGMPSSVASTGGPNSVAL
ncbi:hypothetical protein EOD39_2614 [Acipenser ruthenus]|uniref:Uncharacterized protein n=1 Tax=Acipenser ruthenus TaxID=7906 RepID=A0A444TZN7_ACIRT|nr:hypothetical protein EOD39_2614 [Acipenser ruthenus]